MSAYTLKVNGQDYPVEAADDTPLLWVLRDHLQLTGTKYGCGIGVCGACLVHINGEPARACMITALSVKDYPITTIEGLSPQRSHPVQLAWLEHQVPQCGYCQSGQIMAAAALLAKLPVPSDADIDSAMGQVLCRCGTYQRIRAAIHSAARIKDKES